MLTMDSIIDLFHLHSNFYILKIFLPNGLSKAPAINLKIHYLDIKDIQR
jgi:hypothetical protein